ncbi:MAG: hypothetical protein ACYC9S_06295 [Leptospirales bacterium]
MHPSTLSLSRLLTIISTVGILAFSACSTLPTENHPYAKSGTVPTTPERAKEILESLQKTNPGIHIQAELASVPQGTAAKLTVRTRQKVHLINRGFEEFHGEVARYPDCHHWFYLARSFDRSCGDGPIIGSVTTLFGDGIGLGALFDLFQLARYPFNYSYADKANPAETRKIFQKLNQRATQPKKKPAHQARIEPKKALSGKILVGFR